MEGKGHDICLKRPRKTTKECFSQDGLSAGRDSNPVPHEFVHRLNISDPRRISCNMVYEEEQISVTAE
jgi:hypothetical protein